MPLVEHAHKQVHLKLVYYGPGLGGKTTNLEHIHQKTRPEYRGKLISLTNESERTLFFDLLPVELGLFRGYTLRLHLCTVPGQIRFDMTRRLILRHVDGVVFVVDSQPLAIDANVESAQNLETNLGLQGDDPTRIPLVVQYNKRDLPEVLSVEELRETIGIPSGLPEIEAIAREGVGVFETLKAVTKACLSLLPDPTRAPEGRSPSILPGKRASIYPGGRPSALNGPPNSAGAPMSASIIPRAPGVPRIGESGD